MSKKYDNQSLVSGYNSNNQWKKREAAKHNKRYEEAKAAKAQLEEDKKHPVQAVNRKIRKYFGF